MQLPSYTTILIVGAGPSGLSAALSLLNQGINDITIVDALAQSEHDSRANVIHAATLEALDTVGCANDLVSLGAQAKSSSVRSRHATYVTLQFDSLKGYTRFPFALLLSQARTEEILNEHLESSNIRVLRPFRVVGLSSSEKGINVSFESGEVVCAKYVIGADGAKSVIRTLNGINFADPDGLTPSESADRDIHQIVLADVTFTDPGPPLPTDQINAFGSSAGTFLCIPMPDLDDVDHRRIFRIGFTVPAKDGPPPSHPTISYLQKYVNQNGFPELSSDPSVNSNPFSISRVAWSTRFRTHAAIAETFFKRVEDDRGNMCGVVMLIGDSAHIHSPVGGLGMNLGIRDAISLGPVVAAHINSSSFDNTTSLQEYASLRYQRALHTIKTTKRSMTLLGAIMSKSIIPIVYLIFSIVTKVPFVRNMIVWDMSGLGNR